MRSGKSAEGHEYNIKFSRSSMEISEGEDSVGSFLFSRCREMVPFIEIKGENIIEILNPEFVDREPDADKSLVVDEGEGEGEDDEPSW